MVLNPGKTDRDYRPGTPLSDTMNIVRRPMAEKDRTEANRLETQAPVRGSLEQPLWWKNSTMELSKCYRASNGQLRCATCHDPHMEPARDEAPAFFNCFLEPPASFRINRKEGFSCPDEFSFLGMKKNAGTTVMGSTSQPGKRDEGSVVHLDDIAGHRRVDHKFVVTRMDIIGFDIRVTALYRDDLLEFCEGFSFCENLLGHLGAGVPCGFPGHLQGNAG